MRRWLFVLGIYVATGCGIDVVASKTFNGPDASGGEGGPSNPPPDGAPLGDADVLDALLEAEVVRPDAGVVFVPSHVTPVYSLTAEDVNIIAPSRIDTSSRTLALNGAPAAVSPNIVHSDGVAIWSVGSLTTTERLTVVGDRPLVIVAARDVSIGFTISAYGDLVTPGAGGSLPATGAGKGANGAKSGTDNSGGGGAGHGTAGAVGGDKGAVKGGLGGVVANAGGAILVGGSGGGNGGGVVAGQCAGRGRGGAGGGAIQISAVGKITVINGGGIDVGGGGGAGGCRGNSGDVLTGGGGGGAGGLVVFESVAGIQLDLGSTLEASGGGGGEGGDSNAFGVSGEAGMYPVGIAAGGAGGGAGGNGGNGGVGPAVAVPGFGILGGDTGGGGGGAMGRVFLRTRGAAGLTVVGNVAALRTDDPTF